MNTDLHYLTEVPAGLYRLSPWWKFWGFWGWLDVSRDDRGQTTLVWTSGRHTHNALGAPAWALTVSSKGDLLAYYESVINMWMKWGYGRGSEQEKLKALAHAKESIEFFKTKLSATDEPS